MLHQRLFGWLPLLNAALGLGCIAILSMFFAPSFINGGKEILPDIPQWRYKALLSMFAVGSILFMCIINLIVNYIYLLVLYQIKNRHWIAAAIYILVVLIAAGCAVLMDSVQIGISLLIVTIPFIICSYWVRGKLDDGMAIGRKTVLCFFWLFPLLNIVWVYLLITASSAINFLLGHPAASHTSLIECFMLNEYHPIVIFAFFCYIGISLVVLYIYMAILYHIRERYWIVTAIYTLLLIAVAIGCIMLEHEKVGYAWSVTSILLLFLPSVIVPYLLKRKLNQ